MDFESKEDALEHLLADVGSLMEELYQSGFDTVHDSTMEDLWELTERTKQYGMTYLCELLQLLNQGLSMRRHRIGKEEDKLAEIYIKLNEYLYLCREKIVHDRGQNNYV